MKTILTFLLLSTLVVALTPTELNSIFQKFVDSNQIAGLAVCITKNSSTIYRGNFGLRDVDRNLPVDNNTMFRMASLSKSVTTMAVYQLIEQGKLKLSDSVSSILGYSVANPAFPNTTVTVEHLLTHQSSLNEGTTYDSFLTDTDLATNGSVVPALKDILVSGGKYYNVANFDTEHAPGTFWRYSNLGYVVLGTIVEKLSNTRYDQYMKSNIVSKAGLKGGYNPSDLQDINNLAVLYTGLNNRWIGAKDNFKGVVPSRNLTGYTIGSNAAIFYPHAGLRATVEEMATLVNTFRLGGITPSGTRILQTSSADDIVRPRYQYHGSGFGTPDSFRAYGLGLHTSSYHVVDKVFNNKVTVGHTGSGFGLISGYTYSGDYAFAFAINGIKHGYTYDTTSMYQVERQYVYKMVDQFINEYKAEMIE